MNTCLVFLTMIRVDIGSPTDTVFKYSMSYLFSINTSRPRWSPVSLPV